MFLLSLSIFAMTSRGIVCRTVDLWPEGIIPVEYGSDLNSTDKKRLERVFEDYASVSCVEFRERTGEDADYVHIMKIHEAGGCFSEMIGKMGGEQLVNFGPTCWGYGTLMHELMHILGFGHEEQRSDRDDFVDIHWTRIPVEWRRQYQKLSTLGYEATQVGEYDYGSIMHMPRWNRNFNPKPIMTARKSPQYWNNRQMGNRYALSRYDVEKINRLYNCPPKEAANEEFWFTS